MKTKKVRTSSKYEYLSCSDELSEVVTDINKVSWWIFGVPKIGKTAIAAQFNKAKFAATEQGHKFQRVNKENLYDKPWLAYIEFLDYMRETKKFSTAVVDVLEGAYSSCFKYVKEEVLELDKEPEWGEWAIIRQPFIQWCKDMTNVEGKGCVFLSHASSREIEDGTGDKISSTHPNLAGKVLLETEGIVDILAYFQYLKGHRVLQIEGDDYVRAGNRLTENFLCNGERIKYIPMGKSAAEGYNNIIRAFENRQKPEHLYHIFPPEKTVLKKKKPRSV
jgi:hypothetical protein